MTLVLLDTNVYARLAKRIRPLLGKKFGQNEYVLTVLRDVEDEVHRSPKLKFKYPWFDGENFANERLAFTPRLSSDEKATLASATSVLLGVVQMDLGRFMSKGRAPPGEIDCRMLAFGQIRSAIVVTDDIGMHELASLVKIKVWHGPELLKKMLGAKLIENNLVREIYEALEANQDMTATWITAKHTTFLKIFGKTPN